jgi:predicted nuclease of restriction endonuclease-like (RecB) superfamily
MLDVLSSALSQQMPHLHQVDLKYQLTNTNDLEKLRNEKKMSPNIALRDPYLLDFLGLKDTYSEKDLENAILSELESFIFEMGRDFAFVGRQVRITVNDKDYYIDLLFYHRKLKCLVALELKLDEFQPEYKGQVELYLNWLEKHELNDGENPPMGIILCAKKDEAVVELLKLGDTNIHVAEYITKTLQQKLPQAIKNAKITLEQRENKA